VCRPDITGRVGWREVARALSGTDRVLAVGLLAGVVAFVIVGMSEPLLYKRYALAPAAPLIALGAIRDRSMLIAPRPVPGAGR
jgi:hypothetical protein